MIVIAAGMYQEAVDVTNKNVSLLGGYDAATWLRDKGKRDAVIWRATAQAPALTCGVGSTCLLESLTLERVDPPPESTSVVILSDGSLTMHHVVARAAGIADEQSQPRVIRWRRRSFRNGQRFFTLGKGRTC